VNQQLTYRLYLLEYLFHINISNRDLLDSFPVKNKFLSIGTNGLKMKHYCYSKTLPHLILINCLIAPDGFSITKSNPKQLLKKSASNIPFFQPDQFRCYSELVANRSKITPSCTSTSCNLSLLVISPVHLHLHSVAHFFRKIHLEKLSPPILPGSQFPV
jgi:hypothetical protein